jgi:hypothetical protein
MKESDIQKQILDYLKLKRFVVFNIGTWGL